MLLTGNWLKQAPIGVVTRLAASVRRESRRLVFSTFENKTGRKMKVLSVWTAFCMAQVLSQPYYPKRWELLSGTESKAGMVTTINEPSLENCPPAYATTTMNIDPVGNQVYLVGGTMWLAGEAERKTLI